MLESVCFPCVFLFWQQLNENPAKSRKKYPENPLLHFSPVCVIIPALQFYFHTNCKLLVFFGIFWIVSRETFHAKLIVNRNAR